MSVILTFMQVSISSITIPLRARTPAICTKNFPPPWGFCGWWKVVLSFSTIVLKWYQSSRMAYGKYELDWTHLNRWWCLKPQHALMDCVTIKWLFSMYYIHVWMWKTRPKLLAKSFWWWNNFFSFFQMSLVFPTHFSLSGPFRSLLPSFSRNFISNFG